jgi:Mn2+/Fe2+ NRAMP family transporter
LIQLYSRALGGWAEPLIGIAALATMVSTTLTCLDAYPRTLDKSIKIWKEETNEDCKKNYRLVLFLTVLGTTVIFLFFMKSMGQLVVLATVVAFVSAPVLALINHLVMNGSTVPVEQRPCKLMKNWSRGGIAVLACCSLCYLWVAFAKEKPQSPQVADVAQQEAARGER